MKKSMKGYVVGAAAVAVLIGLAALPGIMQARAMDAQNNTDDIEIILQSGQEMPDITEAPEEEMETLSEFTDISVEIAEPASEGTALPNQITINTTVSKQYNVRISASGIIKCPLCQDKFFKNKV